MSELEFEIDQQKLQEKSRSELIAKIQDLQKRLVELKTINAHWREHNETYALVLDESSDPIFMFYPDGRYRYVNQAFAEGVDKPLDQIIGRSIYDVFPKDEAEKRFAAVKWVFETGEIRVIEVRVPRRDADRYYLTTAKPVLGADGKVDWVICISKEITDRKRMEQELLYLSTHDILTGLYNRNFFDSELARLQLSRLFPIGIVVIDMNNLKATNDKYGHSAGDELIRKVAAELQNSFRMGDIIARIGGDEFAVILTQTDKVGTESAVNRLYANIKKHRDALLSISAGWAIGEVGSYLQIVMREADDRMYEEKAIYRSKIQKRQNNDE
ncbi:MAG TPA: hypothetical protein DEH25_13210 [Chloroflexi bacterium]|nr:hypothetical protein [Chloroflexota bacterium]HBY06386.1 hypothetical protein [Chloroflexota bacterium]